MVLMIMFLCIAGKGYGTVEPRYRHSRVSVPGFSVPITGCVYALYGLDTKNAGIYPRMREFEGLILCIADLASR